MLFDSLALHGTLNSCQNFTTSLPKEFTALTEPTTISEPLPPSTTPSPRRRLTSSDILRRIAALAFALGITAAIFFFAPEIRHFKELGYFGVFLINLIASASVVIPIPGLGITFVSSAVLFWPLVGLASGLGQALGELTGYLAGYGGGIVIEDRPIYKRIQYWMENHGFVTLFILAAIPNPFIDLAGMTAGAMKYPLHKFLLAVWLGKTLKSLVFAWAGAHSVTWITRYWHLY